jgi:protein involved in polysaccharide export with SLBB domain
MSKIDAPLNQQALRRLLELYALAQGATLAANTAVAAAQNAQARYLDALAAIVESLGLPAGRRWQVDFSTGELREQPEPGGG